MGRGRETSIKKLVTCDWEVLPMTGHQFFMAHVTQWAAFGACCPLIACERGGAGSIGSEGSAGVVRRIKIWKRRGDFELGER